MSSVATQDLSKRTRKLFLFSAPRTASNLLMRLLSKQDQFAESEYYFFGAKTSINQDVDTHTNLEVPEDTRKSGRQAVQKAFDNLQKSVEVTETQGQVPFIKEHVIMISNPSIDNPASYQCGPSFWTPIMTGDIKPRLSSNPTFLPDDFLEQWSAIFIIRHPALVLPSLYRTLAKLGTGKELEMFKRHISVTSQPQRTLYDWYIDHGSEVENGSVAVIIDADDVMNDRAVVEEMCDLVGFDKSKLQYEWEARTEEQLREAHPIDKIFKSTLIGSQGIVKGRDSSDLDLHAEAEKWVQEFGVEVGILISEAVASAMDEYEYMRDRRLRGI